MLVAVALITLWAASGFAQSRTAGFNQVYDYEETRALVALVSDAAALVPSKGDAAFVDAYPEFRQKGSKWFSDGTSIGPRGWLPLEKGMRSGSCVTKRTVRFHGHLRVRRQT